MKNILVYCLSIILLTSCGPDSQNQTLTYQNIIIISDLSSRIKNKKQKDIEEIKKIVNYFRNVCVKPGEKIGDRSSISFSTFSEKTISKIDIDEIKSLGDKQQFVNSTEKYVNNGLDSSINNFMKNVSDTYKNSSNNGLDLISILIEKIENESIIKLDTFLTDGIDTTFIKYDNHIYIFTDGYLEYLNKDKNSQFYFGSREIKNVREYCKKNKVDVNNALIRNGSLCLPPVKSYYNKFINLHVLETHERDKNIELQNYNNKKGLRDNEILEAVWRKWAIESGFKELKWYKY